MHPFLFMLINIIVIMNIEHRWCCDYGLGIYLKTWLVQLKINVGADVDGLYAALCFKVHDWYYN